MIEELKKKYGTDFSNTQIKDYEFKDLKCKNCFHNFDSDKNDIFCSKKCEKKYLDNEEAIKKEKLYWEKIELKKKIGNEKNREKIKQLISEGKYELLKDKFLKFRFEIFKRDNFTCQYCGRNPKEDGCKIVIDHIIPQIKGGTDELNNLTTCCRECNSGKKDTLLEKREIRVNLQNLFPLRRQDD